MKSKSLVHYITKYLIDVMFYGGIIACICVPFIAKWAFIGEIYGDHANGYASMLAVLYISGIAAVYILFCLKGMFKTLIGGNPFVAENVTALRRISVACAVVAAVYIIKCILIFPTIACAIIALVFAIGCLFCLTLKDLFKSAVEYKEENDLTI